MTYRVQDVFVLGWAQLPPPPLLFQVCIHLGSHPAARLAVAALVCGAAAQLSRHIEDANAVLLACGRTRRSGVPPLVKRPGLANACHTGSARPARLPAVRNAHQVSSSLPCGACPPGACGEQQRWGEVGWWVALWVVGKSQASQPGGHAATWSHRMSPCPLARSTYTRRLHFCSHHWQGWNQVPTRHRRYASGQQGGVGLVRQQRWLCPPPSLSRSLPPKPHLLRPACRQRQTCRRCAAAPPPPERR